jgi:nucleolar protein 56
MQVRTWFGIFTLDEDRRIIEVELFGKDPETILLRLMQEPLLLRGAVAGTDIRELALRYGFVSTANEYDSMLHALNIGLAKKKVAQAAGPDRRIIAAVEAIDDIDVTSNILAGRLKEWYELNFYETDLKGETLADYIISMKEKEDLHAPELRMVQSLACTLL